MKAVHAGARAQTTVTIEYAYLQLDYILTWTAFEAFILFILW